MGSDFCQCLDLKLRNSSYTHYRAARTRATDLAQPLATEVTTTTCQPSKWKCFIVASVLQALS